ncbi:MAG: hypothetical protein IJS50_02675, partial [Desulfovibrio sp.]|nr:hypothetical protein [Desulfovibrio sp.]
MNNYPSNQISSKPLELILGPMPLGTDLDKVLAAGPWCFAGLEEHFPNWERLCHFAPEPLSLAENLKQAIAMVKALSAEQLPRLAASLSSKAEQLPTIYWETLLTPWLGFVAEQIVERWLRIKALQAKYGEQPLKIKIVSPNPNFVLADENAVTLEGALGHEVNTWLFSYLLRQANLPKAWTLEEKETPKETPKKASAKPSLRAKGKALLRELLLRL